MSKYKKLFSLLASLALSNVVAQALSQTAATTPAAAATPTAVPTPVVTVDGLVDGYYTYNFTNPTVNSTDGYWYNSASNAYTLGLAEIKATATQGQASGHLVLAYGQEAPTSSGGLGIGSGPGIDVLQAYVSYNPGQWTFNFGKFVTWMGYEVIESTGNMNYSHSLLFGALPYWHTGFSANYTPSSTFNITGYVTDGNNTTGASLLGKTYGLEAVLAPDSMWSFTFNGIMGPTIWYLTTQSSATGELIIGYKPDSNWSFALDSQLGNKTVPSGDTASSYYGIALYGKCQIASDYSLALRLETLTDTNDNTVGLYGNGDGPTNETMAGNPYNGKEITLTLEHDFTPNMIARLEGRIDMASYNGASDNAFATNTVGSPTSSQGTGTASVAYTF